VKLFIRKLLFNNMNSASEIDWIDKKCNYYYLNFLLDYPFCYYNFSIQFKQSLDILRITN